ncbi:MAG: ATPase, T2SS/T4P/T4SS family [Maledivibacter sp.]|jgi:pilus assembly protein CpaF|nr:ATPase, T2SS/T4P/T4SS family [Maledivibacter sp.]
MNNFIPNINEAKYLAGIQKRREIKSTITEGTERALENSVDEVRKYLTNNYSDLFEDTLSNDYAREKIKEKVAEFVRTRAIKVEGVDGLDETIKAINLEILDFGVITEYLENESVEEIRVNSPFDIRIVVDGREYYTGKKFTSENVAINIAKKIVRTVGKTLSPSSPIVDARLKNGQRVACIISPNALSGINLTIRKQKKEVFTAEKLIDFGTATKNMFEFLDVLGESEISNMVIGPTNSGKTATLQTILTRLVEKNGDRRIITMEDTAELNVKGAIAWETRNGVSLLDLLIHSLRQSPETMVLGEMRGQEAQTVVAAANTGHQIYNSFHANGPADAPTRVLQMYMMGSTTLTQDMILDMIINAFPLCIFQKKLKDGSRKIMSISELEGYEGGRLKYREIFKFKPIGIEQTQDINPLTGEKFYRKSIIGRHVFNSNISNILHQRFLEAGIDKGIANIYLKGKTEN